MCKYHAPLNIDFEQKDAYIAKKAGTQIKASNLQNYNLEHILYIFI